MIAQEFVENPTVLAVVGHVNSGAMSRRQECTTGACPPLPRPATSPDLTGISSWTFGSSRVIGERPPARALRREAGRHRVAILYANNSYGRGLTDAFSRHFAGDIISVEPIGDGANQNFEPFVSYYRRARPDLIFVAARSVGHHARRARDPRQRSASSSSEADGWTASPS